MKTDRSNPLDQATAAGLDADARELEAYLRAADPVAFEAALWQTRRHEGLSEDAEQEFDAWLAADPAHRAQYEALDPSFVQVRALPREQLRALAQTLQPAPATPTPVLPSPRRRAWMLTVARAIPPIAAAAAGFAVLDGHRLEWDENGAGLVHSRRYITGRGELRDIELSDGSVLQLDAATTLQVYLGSGHRQVKLLEGQAMFSVTHDAARPFDVLAGATRVTVVGTRFSVRHTADGVAAGNTVVAVESGRVRVGPRNASAAGQESGAVLLGAGERVVSDDQGRPGVVAHFAVDGVAPWRQGRVSFDDTPLGLALAEFERYGDTHLRVRDPAVAALRLGGTFDLRAADTFARALPHLLPVRLRQAGDATEIVAAK